MGGIIRYGGVIRYGGDHKVWGDEYRVYEVRVHLLYHYLTINYDIALNYNITKPFTYFDVANLIANLTPLI